MPIRLFAIAVMLATLTAGSTLRADEDVQEFRVVIKDHRFEPAELTVPAGKRLKLVVENQDATPEEFESHSLKREKVVAAGGTITVLIGPLEAGTYDFFGEFNPKTATGKLIAN